MNTEFMYYSVLYMLICNLYCFPYRSLGLVGKELYFRIKFLRKSFMFKLRKTKYEVQYVQHSSWTKPIMNTVCPTSCWTSNSMPNFMLNIYNHTSNNLNNI